MNRPSRHRSYSVRSVHPIAPLPHRWTFLSNHTHVLVCLSRDENQTLREIAAQVGVTLRAVQRIVTDLEAAGILERGRSGRRNVYRLRLDIPLRHPLESRCRIGDLLQAVTPA